MLKIILPFSVSLIWYIWYTYDMYAILFKSLLTVHVNFLIVNYSICYVAVH